MNRIPILDNRPAPRSRFIMMGVFAFCVACCVIARLLVQREMLIAYLVPLAMIACVMLFLIVAAYIQPHVVINTENRTLIVCRGCLRVRVMALSDVVATWSEARLQGDPEFGNKYAVSDMLVRTKGGDRIHIATSSDLSSIALAVGRLAEAIR